ncbi:MAG: CPBP family intramembrane metalloprotease [Rhizobiales bacterium]|nr:CPBP family intramembrane metalloprotease [Hyphomicrobiales bacterium]MBI3673982.1 CPBP family intramembrane metalloprotease [Hyphomicrobiales bacterium]
MALIGSDLRGGPFRRLFVASNTLGLGWAIAVTAGLIIANQVLLSVVAVAIQPLLFDGGIADQRGFMKAALVSFLPVSLLTAALAWLAAGLRGGDPWAVLNLRRPRFGAFGWPLLIIGFMVALIVVMTAVTALLHIDVAQYTPGRHGESPNTGSAGLVKEAMFDIANNRLLFALVVPSVALGPPLAEEMIFRGQLFTVLSQTRLGFSGATVLTSALWAILHASEPWLTVGMIFFMGLIFGWMLYRFGSLWITMACHAAWNTAVSLFVFAAVSS